MLSVVSWARRHQRSRRLLLSLRTAPAPPPPSADGLQTPIAGSLPVYGAASAGSKIFNPDVGMIGNFISATGQSRGGSQSIAPIPFATLQESEASFQAIVDPYARADFFLAIGEEGIEVEEGYVTFPTLPGGLLLKAGKMRANFGRLNAFHNHTLPWVDRPLAMYNLLGGSPLDPDTGIKDAGVSVSRLIPAGKLFVEATGEVFRGDSGTVFKSNRRSDFSTDRASASLRGFHGELEHRDRRVVRPRPQRAWQRFRDAAVRHRCDRGDGDRSAVPSTALSLRGPSCSGVDGKRPVLLQRAFGGYASVDYGFRRRWFAGGRYDWSERANDASIQESRCVRGPHVLAERVQPGPESVSPDAIRRRWPCRE